MKTKLYEFTVFLQFPKTAESYVHRSGRSARGGASGEAIVLLSGADYPSYKKVLNTLKKNDLDSFDRSPPPKAISGTSYNMSHTPGCLKNINYSQKILDTRIIFRSS